MGKLLLLFAGLDLCGEERPAASPAIDGGRRGRFKTFVAFLISAIPRH